jgi:ribosome recycling factor
MPRLTQDQRKALAKVLQMRAAAGKGLSSEERKEARRLSSNLLKLNTMEERKKAAKAKAH